MISTICGAGGVVAEADISDGQARQEITIDEQH